MTSAFQADSEDEVMDASGFFSGSAEADFPHGRVMPRHFYEALHE